MLKSLKLKLFIWFFLSLSIFTTLLGIHLYRSLEASLISFKDDLLNSKLDLIQNFFSIEEDEDGEIVFELTGGMTGEYGRPLSGHYYQILFPDGKPFILSPSLKGRPLPFSLEHASGEPLFETINGPDRKPLRLMTILFEIPYGKAAEKAMFIIQIGEDLEDAMSVLQSFKTLLFYSTALILSLSVLGGFIISWLSLRSLESFSKEVGVITEKTLDRRIDVEKFDREFRGLGNAFNDALNRLEETFNQQQRFLSDASHELRTPVSVIRSYCEVPLRKERDAAEYKKALEVILDNAKRMSGLIEKILTLSRLEQKGFHLNMERVPLSDIVERTVAMLESLSEKRGIRIKFSSPPEKVYILGDNIYLTEVFMNIIDNAIKYNIDGGIVAVAVREDGNEAVVEVKDTGIGVPEDGMAKIFQRFYRIDRSRTKDLQTEPGEARGTGLGLSIAREIVDIHQGRIDVASKIGAGSTFTVYLPKAPS